MTNKQIEEEFHKAFIQGLVYGVQAFVIDNNSDCFRCATDDELFDIIDELDKIKDNNN